MTESTDWSFSDMTLSILGLREEGDEWHAIALELDLHGYGATYDEAKADLVDHIKMQIAFSMQKGKPELVPFATDVTYWKLFAITHAEQFSAWSQPTSEDRQIRTGGLNLPPAHVIAEMEGGFTPAANG